MKELLARHVPGELSELGTCGDRPVWGFTLPGDQAVACWQKLRALVDELQHWPVMIGGAREVKAVRKSLAFPLPPPQPVDADAWFKQRETEQEENEYEAPRGEWNAKIQPNHAFSTPCDLLTQQPIAELHMALIPTTRPWEIPALLRFGNWNECPEPDAHVAILQRWHARYGAELAAINRDTLEFAVPPRPLSRDEALALAREQYLYCSDIVDQGCQTVDNLAASLIGASVWYFWWD